MERNKLGGILALVLAGAGLGVYSNMPSKPSNLVDVNAELNQVYNSSSHRLPEQYALVEFEDFVAVTDENYINPIPLGLRGNAEPVSTGDVGRMSEFSKRVTKLIYDGKIDSNLTRVYGDLVVDANGNPVLNEDGKKVVKLYELSVTRNDGEVESFDFSR